MSRAATIALLIGALCSPLSAAPLNVPLIAQQGGTWCWAAASEMVLAYIDNGTAPGQCTLVKKVTNNACECPGANIYLASDPDCTQYNPFGPDDFIPKLVTGLRITPGNQVPPKAIAMDLLKCEIDTRKMPVIFWWGNNDCAKDPGHLAVAADFMPTDSSGPFIFVLDPLPEGPGGGDTYWLSWRGFACGPWGYGQCAAYYNIQSEPTLPEACKMEVTEQSVNCTGAPGEYEKIDDLAAISGYINKLFQSAKGDEFLQALGIPKGQDSVTCGNDFVMRENLPTTFFGQDLYLRTNRSRVLCRYGPFEFSAVVSMTSSNELYLASFGGMKTSLRLRYQLNKMVDWLRTQPALPAVPKDTPIELEELFLPGSGEVILIESWTKRNFAVRLIDSIETSPRPLDKLLLERLETDSSWEIREFLDFYQKQ